MPDWLRALRGDENQETPASPDQNPPAEQGEVPDWLARIREQDTNEEAAAAPEEEVPLGRSEMPDSPEPAQAAPAEDEPDWLKSLRDTARPEDIARPSETPAAPPGGDEDIPEWLRDLSGTSQPEAPVPTIPQPVEPPPPPASEKPAAGQQESRTAGPEEPPAAGESAAQPAFPADDAWKVGMPDWLSGLEEGSTPPEKPALEETNLPGPSVSPETPVEPFGGTASPEEPQGVPDWLARLDFKKSPEITGQPPASTPVAPVPPAEPTPPVPADIQPIEAAPAGPVGSEMPDWLAEISGSVEGASAPETPSAPEVEEPAAASGADADILPAKADEDNLPEWLRQLQKPEEYPETALPPSAPALVFDESPSGPPPEQEEKAATPFTEDMPDWLARMTPPAEAEPSPGGQEAAPPKGKDEEEITLAPAELPTWVQAMRPIESATPESPAAVASDERVEEGGPLAGLRGVLPPELVGTGIHKPPVYSVRLQTREKQRTDAALLESMVANEAEPQSFTPVKPFPSQRVVRLVIALVLILAVLLALFSGAGQMDLPGYLSEGIGPLQNGISALPADAPVLLAVDYEPALAGEMEAAASSVVAHLMSKGANLVLISTNPSGQLLASRLLQSAYLMQPGYMLQNKTLNLGYLAGGPGALANFAIEPQASTPFTADMQDAWQQPILQKVNSLADFAAIVVVTENLDTARSWVEQVKPSLGNVPLYMVASAQVGPIISAYLNSGQIQGLVTGLTGGAIYEQNTNQIGSGRTNWDGFQYGLLIAIILVLVGGLINSGSALFTRQKPKGEA